MLLFIWICAFIGLGLWSLAAWGLHLVLSADPQWVGDIGELADRVPFGDWLERWIPGWREGLEIALDLAQHALGWVGDYAPFVVWVTWGVGALCVVSVAAGLSLIVVLLRPKAAPAKR